MANTFSKLYVQLVFGVKNRVSLIDDQIKDQIEKYISGVVTAKKCRLMAIYCNPDHIHIFISIHPSIAIADLVRDIKTLSSGWIHREFENLKHFGWQDGYGAFTYAQSQTGAVVKYILRQREHHQKRNFREEYVDLLKKFEIDFDEKFLLDFEM
ncbi:MAG: putative transposase [Bacteroidetes bacterium]|nr:putative transposase [Bacteroidota bacterium]